MKLSSLEEVKHLSRELERIKKVRLALREGANKIRLQFDDAVGDEQPFLIIDAHDYLEHKQIMAAVKSSMERDIAELTARLKELGAHDE